MDWLSHNFIADMYGPHFLILYGGVIIAVLLACSSSINRRDPTKNLSPPLVPANPDPYEIAYLRGGENEVARAVIFNLIHRGYLRVKEEAKAWWSAEVKQQIERAPKPPEPRHLSKLERSVFDWFATPLTAREIFQTDGLTALQTHCLQYEKRLQSEQLLMSEEMQDVALVAGVIGALVIVGLGIYKLVAALSSGHHSVSFLIGMGIIALYILYKICRPSRVSSRGQAYLNRLQQAFEKLKLRANKVASAAADETFVLLVGIFGVGALAGTAYDYYQQMFRRATSSGGSCGGGCGSSSSCGSSCGSCGGGGGCGGCGGD